MDMETIKKLLDEASAVLAARKREKASGRRFNVLDICGVGTVEVRHSAIIAALLDPRGDHGFGAKSLQAFFRQCELPEFAENCNDCHVETEVAIPNRRPDIVIRGHDICVVIENKTNTGDHWMQLADYRDWLKDQPVSRKHLLYLTYTGSEAGDPNIKADEYQRISYTGTLRNWLMECANMADNAAADFCGQYAKFIQQEIMENTTMATREELKKLLDTPDKIQAAQELAAAVNEIKTSKFIDLFNEWAKNCGVPVAKYLDSADTYAGILFETDHEELAPCFEFGTSGFRNFNFGLTWKSGMKLTDAHKYNNVSGWNHSEWWPYYKFFEGEFRNPGENLDFLGDGKQKLFAAMDRALRELMALTPSRIC